MYFSLFWIIRTMLTIQLASFFSGVRFVGVDGEFTKTPPSVLVVPEGGNASFTWEYYVRDRDTEFRDYSPMWRFYENATTSIIIAFDNGLDSWKWEIGKNCPPRLLNPKRVFKGKNATLIITNVNAADSGVYGCTLDLQSPSQQKTEKSQLIVTVHPQITITGETTVVEYSNLTLNCSAVGPPTPNVTWISEAGVVLAQGIGSASLIVINITREQSGTIYKCNATNNPNVNEQPVAQKEINVTVNFPPELNRIHSTYKKEACPGKKVEIVCAANGRPPPRYYWYNPYNKSVGEIITGEESKIKEVVINGTWTCNITNGIGQDIDHKVQVIELSKDDKRCKIEHKEKGFTTGEKVGFAFGLIIAVVIIAVVIYVIIARKKANKDLTTVEKALIITGLVVAVIIIIVIVVVIIVRIA